MRASELMIGDYVRYNGHIQQIRSLTCDDGCTLSMELHSKLCSNLEAIPITADVLERMGFKKVEGDQFVYPHYIFYPDKMLCDSLHVGFDDSGNGLSPYCTYYINDDDIQLDSLDLCYVHELQHIINMLQVKMEIKL